MFLLLIRGTDYFLIAAAILAAVIIGFVVYCAFSASKLRKDFARFRIGMTDEEVVAILGVPNSQNDVDGVLVCMWERKPVLGVGIVRTAYIKDGVVQSVSED